MVATVKSSTVQVIDGPQVAATLVTGQMATVPQGQENTVTAQAMYQDAPAVAAQAVTKTLLLGAPSVTSVKSSTIQIIDAPSVDPSVTLVTGQLATIQDNTENSVTAQAMYVDEPGSLAKAVTKTLILQPVVSTEVSNESLEVLADSTIIPPKPGQRLVWFFNGG